MVGTEERLLYPAIEARYLTILNSSHIRDLKGRISIAYKYISHISYPEIPLEIYKLFSQYVETVQCSEVSMEQVLSPKMPLGSQVQIVYHPIQKKTVELGSYFAINATIEFLEKLDSDLRYTVDGGSNWAIIGRSKVIIRQPKAGEKVEVVVQGIPVRYGEVQIPDIKIEIVNERAGLRVKGSGVAQTVTVRPRAIVSAVPKKQ